MATIFDKPNDRSRSLIRTDKEDYLEERLEELLMDGLQSEPARPVDDGFWQELESKIKKRFEETPPCLPLSGEE